MMPQGGALEVGSKSILAENAQVHVGELSGDLEIPATAGLETGATIAGTRSEADWG